MAILIFLAGSALLAATALLLSATLRQDSMPGFLLAAYLLACAELVGLAEALSPFHAVTRTGYFVGLGTLFGISVCIWRARGSPRPPVLRAERIQALPSHPVLLLLAVVVCLGLVYEFAVGITTPPNDWDALWYHLARAAAWRQDRSVEAIANSNSPLGINSAPPDGEIQVLFGLVLQSGDMFTTIPQLMSECALLVAVYGLGRRVGFPRAGSAFAALLTATLSDVALQSATTQNDLCVAAAIAAAVFFAFGHDRTDVVLAGLGIGLALGTKLTALLALPVLCLAVLTVGRTRRVIALTAVSVVCFALFGAFIYLQHGGNVTAVASVQTGHGSTRAELSPTNAISTASRVIYDFIDLSGFRHVLDSGIGLVLLLFAIPLAAAVVARRWARSVALASIVPILAVALALGGHELFGALHIPLNPLNATSTGRFSAALNLRANESSSYYGPVGMLLLWPLSAWGCIAWARGKIDRKVGLLAAALPTSLLVFALTLSYTPYVGRYFIGPVALAMPLAALIYRKAVLARAVALTGVVAIVLVQAFNPAKPIGLAGTTPIWSLSRPDALALEWPAMRTVLERVAKEVPQNAHVGLELKGTDWSYPFYGWSLGRTVTYLGITDFRRPAVADHLSWLIAHRPERGRMTWRVIPIGQPTDPARSSGRERRRAAGRAAQAGARSKLERGNNRRNALPPYGARGSPRAQ